MGARVLVIDDSATIRKLVSAILARHGYVPVVANDGRAALDKLRTTEIDLVILDAALPRMSARQFCKFVREDARLQSIPIVLMSAKEEIAQEFVQRGEVASAIAKPFRPQSLIEAVESALAEEIVAELDEEDAVEISESRRRSSLLAGEPVVQELARILAGVAAAPIAELSDGARRDPAAIEAVLARVLPSKLDEIAALFGQGPTSEAEAALAGDIATIALGEILQVLHFQRQTGQLRVKSGDVQVVVYLREGLVDLVQGQGMSEKLRLGRYLVEEGLVSRDELEALLRDRSEKKLLGEMLVELGVIGEDELKQALTRQSSELIYELLRCTNGRFTFTHRVFPYEARAARLSMSVASVVMEGFRRIDEWQLIEESLDFDEVLFCDDGALEALDSTKLSHRERLVLKAIDGRTSAREIVAKLEINPFDGYKTLYELLRSRLVRRRAA